MSEHTPTPVPTTLSLAQSLGHEALPAGHSKTVPAGVSLSASEPSPGDLCHIGLCDEALHTRVNYYYDNNLNCNVAVKAPC